jgi:hypothetical protein
LRIVAIRHTDSTDLPASCPAASNLRNRLHDLRPSRGECRDFYPFDVACLLNLVAARDT